MPLSTTSLLKSAASRRAKIRSMEDAEIAFQWENSAQTYDDFLAYSKFLEDRVGQTSDPSDQLSYQRKIRTARRSYTSNELQRQQMAIMEGRASTKEKMDSVQALYEQAIDNGDYNLAQNLYSQWDSLSIKLQNELETAANKFATAGKEAFEELESSLTNGFDDVTLPNGQTVTPLAALEENFTQTGDITAVAKAAQETLEALGAVITDRYQSGLITESDARSLEKKYGQGLRNLNKGLKVKLGGMDLNYEDVINSIANDSFNNPIFGLKAVRNEATGQTEFKIQRNNTERIDYVRRINPETGEEEFAPAKIRTDKSKVMFGSSDQGRGLGTQLTNEGEVIGGDGSIRAGEDKVKRNDSQTIQNRLKSLGIEAKQNGTTLSILLPGENVEREATIQPDGSIRYFNDEGQIVEFGLTRRNLGTDTMPQIFEPGQQRIVSPDELSDFGSQSAFGGTLSQASFQGQRYTTDIIGQAKVDPSTQLRGPIGVANNFAGYGTSVTSNLLQTAGAIRQANQVEQQRQIMLQAAQEKMQASNTINLNQTPVQQWADSGVLKQQLRVATPAPTPKLFVSRAQTQNITGTSVARPTQRISGVVSLPAQPRVRVY